MDKKRDKKLKKKKAFILSIMKHQNRLSREVTKGLSSKIFQALDRTV